MIRKKRCLTCDYADPSGLVQVWLCRNHHAELIGRSVLEKHHIVGRKHNEGTIWVDSNLHGYLTAAMRNWPDTLREHDSGAPLIQSARAQAALIDHMKWFLKHHERLPAYHVAMHLQRLENEGDRYWERDDLGPIDISADQENP